MNHTTASIPSRLGLRAGNWIVVRTKEEILSTLDKNACLDNLPFQPEMFAFCGQRMRVSKVAHKTCNTINKTAGRGRRMLNAVHLEGVRCDGAGHGGCQAGCVFFWKEAWLRKVNDVEIVSTLSSTMAAKCTEDDVWKRACASGDEKSNDPTWVCQTTALFDATGPLNRWDIRQYIRDITSGNHSGWHMFKILVFAGYRKFVNLGIGYRFKISLFNGFQKLRGGKPYPLDKGLIRDGQPTPSEVLDLQPGEWVEVRSQEEILATINESGFNRGMRYDMEMSRYCDKRYRVHLRVERLINEVTGKMMTMKNPCIQLEDVYCRAECTDERLGCPRASNTYWREIWLRRSDVATLGNYRPS